MEKLQATFQTEYIFNPIRKLFVDSHTSTLLGFRAIENLTEIPEPSFEELQIMQIALTQEKSLEIKKQDFKNCVLIKGFEEIHSAIRESLERFLIFVSVVKEFKSKEYTLLVYENFEKEVIRKVKKMNHPVLVQNISKEIQEDLFYERHIDTINNARNCLIHDYAKVGQYRCNNELKTELQIIGNKFVAFYILENDDKKYFVEIGKDIIPAGAYFHSGFEEFILTFKIGETLNLSYEDYLYILNTCLLYEIDLRNKINKYCA